MYKRQLVGHLSLSIDDRQKLLEESNLEERSKLLVNLLENQLDLTQMEKKIRDRVKKQMEKSQKEYYLSEQMKALKKEMGEGDESDDEVEILEKKIADSGMTKEALEKVNAELNKFKMMPPMSAEASVVRGYIDWMVIIPWKKKSKVQKNNQKASEVLEKDHHGLEEVKERILEFLAVQKRVTKIKGPVSVSYTHLTMPTKRIV